MFCNTLAMESLLSIALQGQRPVTAMRREAVS